MIPLTSIACEYGPLAKTRENPNKRKKYCETVIHISLWM